MVELAAVIDTNVLVAALNSKQGYSYRLLLAVGTGRFDIAVSVPLVFEYEAAAKRFVGRSGLTADDVDTVIDYLCSVARRQAIHYLWRPYLPDAKDDMVLEVAVAANCKYITTFNTADFRGTERFGVAAVQPKQFLELVGGDV